MPCVSQTLASTRTWVEARQVPPVSRILEKWWKVDGGGGGGGERRWRWTRGRRPHSYDLGGTLHKCRNYMFNRGKQKEQRSVSRLQNESFCKPFSVNPFQKAPFSFGFSLKSLKIQSANSSKGHATPPATATTKLHPQRRQCAVSWPVSSTRLRPLLYICVCVCVCVCVFANLYIYSTKRKNPHVENGGKHKDDDAADYRAWCQDVYMNIYIFTHINMHRSVAGSTVSGGNGGKLPSLLQRHACVCVADYRDWCQYIYLTIYIYTT